ncbi:hypothetical protein BJ170DRAFT_207089 [Xylariales sp. AK1849]|nr:hypothetical protein BJ170DRAFT_207089 [Xylariales sp. AK1849]
MTLHSPPTPGASTFSPIPVALSPLPNGNQDPPAKRRRIGNMPGSFLNAAKATAVIDNQILQCGGYEALEVTTERPRYQLLRDACVDGDIYFVALHQLFCAWSNSNSAARKQLFLHLLAYSERTSCRIESFKCRKERSNSLESCQISRKQILTPHIDNLCVDGHHDASLVDNAFGLMGTILKSNSKLRPEHLQWFLSFPGPLDSMLNEFPSYAKIISQVLTFLVNLSRHWMVVNHDHRRRGYPLLMDELLNTFQLFSPVLQTIVFRASRRTLGVADGPIGVEMDDIFVQDQQAHRNVSSNYRTIAAGDYTKDPYNSWLIQKYHALVSQIRGANQMAQKTQQVTQDQHHRQSQQQAQSYHPPPEAVNGYPTFSRSPNSTRAPVVPSNGNVAVNQPSITYSTNNASSMENQIFFPPNTGPPQYQFPSTQIPMLPTNFSPTNGHFPNTPPYHSPNMSQGQLPQSRGHTGAHGGGQFGGSVQPPQPSHQGYIQHPQHLLHHTMPRRTSQQFTQVPSTRSPPVQNLMVLPLQPGQESPSNMQNMVGQSPQSQVQFVGNSSPQPRNLQVPAQMQSRRGSAHSSQSPLTGVPPINPSLVNSNSNMHDPLLEQHMVRQHMVQQQQQLAHQQQITHHVRQSTARPQSGGHGQSHRGGVTGSPTPIRRIDYITPAEYPHDPYERKSLESSLHQAHVRSPRRVPKGFTLGTSFVKATERHYQSVKYLAMQPTAVPPQPYLQELTFNMPEVICARISRDVVIHTDSLPVNIYTDGSLRIRLRCCLLRNNTNSISESTWVTTETSWPEHIFLQLNGQTLTVKRKQHHHKDQALEIGAFVKPWVNTLKLTVPPARPIPNNMKPFIAVEVVETLIHSSVRALPNLACTASRIPSEKTRATIQKRLAGSAGNDDDDIAMVVSDLTINIADPFSFTVSNIPVRGKDCAHLECFDLETWLETRPSKKSCVCGAKPPSSCVHCPKEPSFVDKWKCPHCQGDARPYSLLVDSFFLEVRESLAAQGLLGTKAIVVSQDGSWMPVIADDDSDVDSDDGTRPRTATEPRTSAKPPKQIAPVEVICLDDD